MNLSGKVALITGAAQGLGKAFSEALLSKGAKVCLADIKVQQGQITVDELKKKYGEDNSFFVKCDVQSSQDLTDAFTDVKKRYGKLDIVVNNAGIANEANWREMININLIAVIHGTQLGMEHMSRDRGGQGGVIINIASTAGLQPVFFSPSYCASKFGVVGYTRSLAQHPDYSKNGLRFCCLCPAFTDTDIIQIKPGIALGSTSQMRKAINYIGINKVSTVADGFMTLVMDEENNGAVMDITVRDGIQYKFLPNSKSRL